MDRHSRRRLLRLGGTALALSLSGCVDSRTDDGASSPTRTGPARSEATESPGASESATDPTTESGATHAPQDTSSTGTEPSHDCTFYDVSLSNDTDETVDVSARLVEGRRQTTSHGVGHSPTATRREAVWSASARLRGGESRSYEDVPDREGSHRLTVDVKDGPRETETVDGDDWEDNRFIGVHIRWNDIRFSRLHGDPSTRC